ncbi:MAG TPA: YqcC family protein [Xanthomonadales bacterium]|nr:YqcC family protein [Xanthomonadales bacterium]
MSWFTKLRHAMPGSLDDTTWRNALARQLDAIEAELRRIGWWQATPLSPEQMQFTQAFGADTMAFSQWLQFVFVPNAREAVAGKRPLPRRSMVGAQAVREFDGVEEAEQLCSLLSSFDVAIEGRKLPP